MAKKPGPKPTKKFDDEWGDKPLFKKSVPDKSLPDKSLPDKSLLADGASQPLQGDALVKETCRRLRAAKGLWDAHRNPACRREREKALALYNQLTKAQKEKVPQQLRIWLRYRSEKYFGEHQTKPGSKKRSAKGKPSQAKKKGKGRK